MPRSRNLAAALALIALAAPASAWAQSAGGDQYSDPLAGTPGHHSSGGGGGSTGSSSSPAPSSTSSGSTATASSSAGPREATPARPGELPRTGGEVGLVAWIGFALMLAGLTLRRRLAVEPRPY